MRGATKGDENAMLVALGLALVIGATAIHGPFTIDEGMYQGSLAALRAGGLEVPGTAGLPPSQELVAFDPAAHEAVITKTPVHPRVPPLWAFLAWPLSLAGYGALFWVNAALLALTLVGVERWMVRHEYGASARLGAVGALGMGAYLLEYAQGAWPHVTSLALIFAAFACTSAHRRGGARSWLVAAGLLAGVTAGIRYQNAALGVALGVGVLLPGSGRSIRARVADLVAFGVGAAGPLLVSSWANHVRIGSWNPISKGPGYLPTAGLGSGGGGPAHAVGSSIVALWSRVVDHRLAPGFSPTGAHGYLKKDPESGAVLIGPFMKKALLQSAPWAALGMVVLLWAWRRPTRSAAERELRVMGLLVAAQFMVFALAGPHRTDGLCFNQRYLIESLPFLAIATGAALPRIDRPSAWAAGAGMLLMGWLAHGLGGGGVETAWMKSALPLGLAAGMLGSAALLLRPGGAWTRRAPWAAFGLCVGWGLGVHLGDDIVPSRALRAQRAGLLEVASAHVPPDSALFVYWGNKDPYGPMQFTHRTLVVDPWPDRGESSPQIVEALRDRGQRIFVVVHGMPPEVLAKVVGRHELVPVADRYDQPFLAELR